MRSFEVVLLQIVIRIVNHNVSIGTTISKVVDTDTAETSRPLSRDRGNFNLPLSQLDLGVDILQAMGRCHQATFEAVHGLDHSGDATAALQMSHIAFHGSHVQRTISCRAEGGTNRGTFDWVTSCGTRAVSLKVVGLAQGQPCRLIRLANQFRLSDCGWLCETESSAVLVGSGGADDGTDGVAITESQIHSLQDNESTTFATGVSIG